MMEIFLFSERINNSKTIPLLKELNFVKKVYNIFNEVILWKDQIY